jgi:predicted dienelactone hydrolase
MPTGPAATKKVMVYIWYPAALSDRNATAPYIPGFDEIRSNLSDADIAAMFRPAIYTGANSLPKTHVLENAPMSPGKEKYPLLVFSHGWGNPTFLYTAELEDLVSHGYVVAAIDHPGDSAFTRFPDGDLALFA